MPVECQVRKTGPVPIHMGLTGSEDRPQNERGVLHVITNSNECHKEREKGLARRVQHRRVT